MNNASEQLGATSERADEPAIMRRTVEVLFALAVIAFGAVVVIDSLRIGARWAEDGPQAGYFPFYVGLLVCGAGLSVLWTTWRQRHLSKAVFLTRHQLKQVVALLVPLTIFIVLIQPVGIYVASVGLIAWFMKRHGQHRYWVTATVALAVPALLFVTFEIWFKTPLPKGPLEALLGFQ